MMANDPAPGSAPSGPAPAPAPSNLAPAPSTPPPATPPPLPPANPNLLGPALRGNEPAPKPRT